VTATEGLAHSIHTCLVAKAKELGIEAQLLLERYALHRLLFRLSKSSYVDRFLLKGAQLMLIWIGESTRMTRDADLLGFGEITDAELGRIMADICMEPVVDDGMEYLDKSIRITPIREETAYGGRRIKLQARLGNARLPIQVDVGIGDAVMPEPEWVELPQILDLPAPRLRAYRPETSIAEKLEAIVARGLLNSRLKDYFNIYVLSAREPFELQVFSGAVRNTFERRGTSIPPELPDGLTRAFADAAGKMLQWRGFLEKSSVVDISEDLGDVVASIAEFLGLAIVGAQGRGNPDWHWPSGGPWSSKEDE
jgi:predicted nucleotidyltransferase component of viral defense system